MTMIRIFFIVLIVFLGPICITGHADPGTEDTTVYPQISKFVRSRDFARYNNLAVLPFSDAPNAPNSGQIAQGLASIILGRAGFKVVERSRLNNVLDEQKLLLSGLVNDNQAIKIGKILGVKGVVVGGVGQYESIIRTHRSVCEGRNPHMIPFMGLDCSKSEWIPERLQITSYVSATLRVIDVESGEIIYSASGYFPKGLIDPPQAILESLLFYMMMNWSDKFE